MYIYIHVQTSPRALKRAGRPTRKEESTEDCVLASCAHRVYRQVLSPARMRLRRGVYRRGAEGKRSTHFEAPVEGRSSDTPCSVIRNKISRLLMKKKR